MSVEFKIIGDLTLKQFFFLLAFCGLAYVSFMLVQSFIIKWLLVIFFVITGLCFAFLPLGDRGLDVWIVNFLKAMFLSNQFVYRKEEEVPNFFLYQNLDVLKSELITLTPTSSRRKIEAYLEQQEAPVDKLDYDEKSYILKVKEAYSGNFSNLGSNVVYTPPATIDYVQTAPVENVDVSIRGYNIPQTLVKTDDSIHQIEVNVPQEAPQPPVDNKIPMLVEIPPEPPKSSEQPEDLIVQVSSRGQDLSQPEVPSPKPLPETVTPVNVVEQQIVRSHAGYKRHKPKNTGLQSGYYSPSMTPDMHSGRRFINLSQEASRGEIILPIRGERILSSEGDKKFENDEAQKVKELDALINQIKSKELVQRQIIESQKIQEAEEIKRKSFQENIKQENTSALEETRKQEEEREKQAKAEEEKRKAQEENQRLREKEEALRKQKEDLIKKQREEEEERQKKIQKEGVSLPQRPQPQPIPLQPAQAQDLPAVPNIVWGLVTTIYDSNKIPVPGVVVIIRNQKKEVVRAVKTSAQGKFGITTPLVNGSYTIEVDKENKSGLNFAITAVEAKGQVVPTLEIVGKA